MSVAKLLDGPYDGAEFDIRQWTKITHTVYCYKGGRGFHGIMLSQKDRPGSTPYILLREQGDTYTYQFEGTRSGGDGGPSKGEPQPIEVEVPVEAPKEPVYA